MALKTLRKRPHHTATIAVLAFTLLLGILYPLWSSPGSASRVPGQRQRPAGPRRRDARRLQADRPRTSAMSSSTRRPGQTPAGQRQPVTTPDPRYFQTRPSGTTRPITRPGARFANYGPNSTVTEQALAANIAAYIALNGRYYPGGLTAAKIPVDAARHLRIGDRTPTSRSPTPTSRPTASAAVRHPPV